MKDSLEETYRHERPRLIGWMKGRIGAEEAEDALHDVFVRCLVNLDTLAGVRDLTAWLWQGARRAVIDVWRKRARRRAAGLVETDGDDFDAFIREFADAPDGRLEKEELLAALADAIDGLSAEQREVIVAQGLKGETFRSISGRTGIPVETLAARKRYAIERLRRDLSVYREE